MEVPWRSLNIWFHSLRFPLFKYQNFLICSNIKNFFNFSSRQGFAKRDQLVYFWHFNKVVATKIYNFDSAKSGNRCLKSWCKANLIKNDLSILQINICLHLITLLFLVSAWYGLEGESTRKINKSWDFQPFIAVEDNKQTSYHFYTLDNFKRRSWNRMKFLFIIAVHFMQAALILGRCLREQYSNVSLSNRERERRPIMCRRIPKP